MQSLVVPNTNAAPCVLLFDKASLETSVAYPQVLWPQLNFHEFYKTGGKKAHGEVDATNEEIGFFGSESGRNDVAAFLHQLLNSNEEHQ